MKEEIVFWKVLVFVLIGLFALVMILISQTKIEGECSLNGLSLKLNETNYPKNITISDGEIKCHFKGEGPLLPFIGR